MKRMFDEMTGRGRKKTNSLNEGEDEDVQEGCKERLVE